MIVSTVKARIVKNPPGALEWAHEMATFVKNKTGNDVEVLVRMGATQDIVWLQRHQDISAYEKSFLAVQSDPDYQARVKQAQSKDYFDTVTVEAGIWRQI